MALRRAFSTLPRPPPCPAACPAPSATPPCAPCPPAPPPPCRVRQHVPRATERVVCHPPPQGRRPPCAPCLPVPPRTCVHALAENAQKKKQLCKRTLDESPEEVTAGACDAARDPVTRRLTAAAAARRADYLRDVAATAARAPPAPPPPPTIIAPPTAHDHAERCVRRPPQALDPCTYKPRKIIEIDRTKTNEGDYKVTPEDASPPAAAPCVATPAAPMPPPPPAAASSKPCCETEKQASSRGLTSRIIESLKLSPKPASEPQPSAPPSRCAMPPPAPQAPRCRERSLVEWLRGRKGGQGGKGGRRGSRSLHTSATALTSEQVRAMLEERSRLKETGRGRDLPRGGRVRACAPGASLAGRLELRALPLPPTRALRVDVYALHDAPPAPPAPQAQPPAPVKGGDCAAPAPRTSPCGGPPPPPPSDTAPSKKDSWLSIKTLQKKISPARPLPPRA